MQVFGIDISVHQAGMSLEKAKAEGVRFAIIRGMYGNAKDTEFETHYRKVKAAGLGCGAYQWGRAKNKQQAKEEAELFSKADTVTFSEELVEGYIPGNCFSESFYSTKEDKCTLERVKLLSSRSAFRYLFVKAGIISRSA